ncbi:glycosyltransferase family 4 protein [Actinomycetospora straminea]|uniref:glycosyltransferase family 4 protein n=1 Tax=Actinomycetospora straminea TaxID=663607 RepID=UPI00236570F2|nr:glycosyltransferase family 4 protein [Actinomycetospora straminea]MDD7931051.1 glycosyltransferase family 4 protein [Actinomycetospora straminea]
MRCHYFRDTRVRREVDALLDLEFEVEVFCLRDAGESSREQRGALLIRRLPLRHRAGAGAARLLAEYASFFVLAMILISWRAARRPFELVQVNSVPDALVFVTVLARARGARVLLDLQEPMPEFFATKFEVTMSHPAVRLVAGLEQAAIRFAAHVITPTEPMRREFVRRGADPHKISVVMDGADEQVFVPSSAHGEAYSRFVIVSHGTIEPQYGLDTLIRAAAQLRDELPDFEVRIIGDGSQREELRALAASLGLERWVHFSDGFVPEDELIRLLSSASLGVVAMKRDRFRDLTIAGKMFDFVALGIPMVVSRTRSVEEIFGSDCYEGFVPDQPEDLARAIRRLHDDRLRAKALTENAHERVRPIAWPVQRRRYQEIARGDR